MYKIYLYPMRNTDLKFYDIGFGFSKPSLSDFKLYTLAYEGEINCESKNEYDVLESIFLKFNINHPVDYKNRSLCVGDIVELNNKKYIVNDFGFEEINL